MLSSNGYFVHGKTVTQIQERKELLKGNFRDRHYNAGSILLGFGVFEAVGGGVNTWFRTGKLFPGPHLFAGAGMLMISVFDQKEKKTKKLQRLKKLRMFN